MDITDLRRLSARHELSLNYIYKDFMISTALLSLKDDRLVLKGGTAINRLYLKERARFSEDIDLDLKTDGSMNDAIEQTKEIMKGISGFDIEKPHLMGRTIRFDAFFMNPLNMKDRIMIEFSPQKMVPKCAKEVVNFGFVPSEAVLMRVYSLETLLRQKLDCLLLRTEGKDIYDVFYLADLCPLRPSKKEFEEIAKKLSFSAKEVKNIANATNHYIPKSLRPDWLLFIAQLKEKLRTK